MATISRNPGSGDGARCAMCDGKFGLVRHYSWRSPLCSRSCLDRFRARRESDRAWVGWFCAAFEQSSQSGATAQ